MNKYTLKDWLLGKVSSLEYWFAKRWLDRTFGKQEYWGDYIQGLISKSAEKAKK
jgi:hypothetical protein